MSGNTLRDDLRNVAIVAHVDHGKTTLVDAMLRQAGAFAAHQAERVDDRVDGLRRPGAREGHHDPRQEHRGPLHRTAPSGEPMTINIIDTPGHADFGGEVERGLSMVDGVVLLVDASEGPLPQTRFVLRKALRRRPAGRSWWSTRSTGPTPGSTRSSTRPTSCSWTCSTTTDGPGPLDFPIVYASARAGRASLTQPEDGGDAGHRRPRAAVPDAPRARSRPRRTTEGAPLQAHVTNLDASPFLGRLALCRVHEGTMRKGQRSPGASATARSQNVKITELLMTEALDRKPGRVGRPRRHHRRRRHRGDHDRRDPGRPGEPARRCR